MTKLGLVIAVMCVACGGGEDPPSCQQAMTSYYGAGCAFFGQDGSETPQNQALQSCVEIAVDNAPGCQDEFDDWLFCLDRVPGPPPTNAGCDCSQEIMALITCN
jgi:hypothetical protein